MDGSGEQDSLGMRRAAKRFAPLFMAVLGFFAGFQPQPTQAADAGRDGVVAHAVVLTPRHNGASLAMELSDAPAFSVSVMAKPDRIIIDLPKVAFASPSTKTSGKVGPVSAYRYGLFFADRSRIVIDLAEPALLDRTDVFDADGRKRLIFHLVRVDRARFADAAARLNANRSVTPPRNDAAAAQGRDAKPLVVLDPGHGGIDGGAATADGAQEKTIVLALALALRDRLERNGKVRVALTRAEDSFVTLNDRVRFARDRKADLMVSLHADKLLYEKGVRGASVYTVSEKASDDISAKLADSENASDLNAGVEQVDDASIAGDILFDLTKRETRVSSVGFARQLAGSLPQVTSMHKVPLRSAGFRVLTAPDVPSVLIETGYLSSAEDALLLKSEEWRRRMAETLAASIEKFLGENATGMTKSASRP